MSDAAAPAPAREIPFVTDFMRVLRVTISPGEVFAEQVEKPKWLGPFIVISLLSVIVSALSAPYTQRIMDLAIAARGGQAVPESARKIGTFFAYLGTPIFVIVLSLLGAGIMYLVLMVTSGKARFVGLLSASMYAKIMFIVQGIVQIAIWKVRGTPQQAIATMQDAQVAIGADLLLASDSTVSPFLRVLLGSINPLSIWGLIICAVGVMVLEKQSKGSAWTATLAQFVILVLIAAAMAGGRSAGVE